MDDTKQVLPLFIRMDMGVKKGLVYSPQNWSHIPRFSLV